ncbi:hypothetical protein CR513_38762, partial [Mucuna pruriens]
MERYELNVRREVLSSVQDSGHPEGERFNKLCATCSHHQISEQLLLQYFYERLLLMDQNMIDAASEGALMYKTPINLGSEDEPAPQKTFDNQRLENQLTELTSLVRQPAVGQHQQAA